MKISELQLQILKICFNVGRDTNQLIRIFSNEYNPQTVFNAVSLLTRLGYLNKKKRGRFNLYSTSKIGRSLILGEGLVEEIAFGSSEPEQLCLLSFLIKK